MNYEAILTEAHEAATAAIMAKFEAGDTEHEFNCGFAWVNIDGNEALARHCRKSVNDRDFTSTRKYGSKGYPKGWQWWKPGDWPTAEQVGRTVYGQDMDFMRAGADAFNKVLAKYGIRGTVGTRLD